MLLQYIEVCNRRIPIDSFHIDGKIEYAEFVYLIK